jgi:MFS transporter, SET family, sugar efflux transporter
MNLVIWKRIINAEYGIWIGSGILLQGFLIAISSPLLPIMLTNHIGLDKRGVTIFYLTLTLTSILVTLITGYLSDGTIARYKLVAVAGSIGVLGNLVLGAATQPLHAFIAAPLIVGSAILFPQLFAVAKVGMMADWELAAQVRGITTLRTLYSLGFIFGTALASWLVTSINFQALFFLVACGGLILTLYGVRVLYRMEALIAQHPPHSPKATAVAVPPTYANALPLSTLLVPLLVLMILQGADSTRQVYLSLVTFQLFANARIAPLMFGISATFELITMGLLGYLASRMGARRVMAGAALVGALYFIIMSVTQLLPVMFVAQAVYAIFIAALVGVAMAYIQSLLAHRAGLGGSLYMAVVNVGSLVGILTPLLVPGYDQQVFIIPAILCVLGAVLLFVGDKTSDIDIAAQK